MAIAGLAALCLGVAFAHGAAMPSERACLLAWNEPANASNRAWVVANGPWANGSLRPGMAVTASFKRGSSPQSTSTVACILVLVQRQSIRMVI
jgi:hypothetical protein